jgi:hypothetical protein
MADALPIKSRTCPQNLFIGVLYRQSYITPPAAKDGLISAVFFLDTNRGWVLLEHGEPDIPFGLRLDLATTDDSGAAWSVEPCGSNSGVESLTFVDPSHGWLAFYGGRNSMSSGYGTVLATSDGGKSWGPTNLRNHFHHQSPSGPMLMITQQFGWMVAGGDSLYITRDGAKTWQRIELESPVKTDQMREYDRNFEHFESSFQALPPAAAKLARDGRRRKTARMPPTIYPHSRIPSTAMSALPILE